MGGYVFSTIIGWLKEGNSYGWCHYDAKEEQRKSALKSGKNSKKVEIFKNNISLGIFPSCHELERQSEEIFGIKLLFGGISAVCTGIKEKYKGYIFKYV